MTKNFAAKRAASEYQRANPGTTRPEAMRVVKRAQGAANTGWRHGQTPWLRTLGGGSVECYFCGRAKVIRSFVDEGRDNGRISMYCENSNCAAREFEVIVVDDGAAGTRSRTDVRIMQHFGPVTTRPTWNIRRDQDWAAGTAPHARTTAHPTRCLFCGASSSYLSAADTATDHGRILLRCANPHCAVVDVEVLVMRDATLATARRPDVRALQAISPINFGRPEPVPGELPIFSFDELREHASKFDAVQLRVSAPVPWGE